MKIWLILIVFAICQLFVFTPAVFLRRIPAANLTADQTVAVNVQLRWAAVQCICVQGAERRRALLWSGQTKATSLSLSLHSRDVASQ